MIVVTCFTHIRPESLSGTGCLDLSLSLVFSVPAKLMLVFLNV
jgi:hypothetical protein